MVGVALENARLYHDAWESNRRLRETNERLTELDDLKSEFLDNVSHELKTPLAVIKAFVLKPLKMSAYVWSPFASWN